MSSESTAEGRVGVDDADRWGKTVPYSIRVYSVLELILIPRGVGPQVTVAVVCHHYFSPSPRLPSQLQCTASLPFDVTCLVAAGGT